MAGKREVRNLSYLYDIQAICNSLLKMEEISKTEKSLQSGTYTVKNENKLNSYAFCTEVHFCLASPAQFRAIGLELDI